jgi:hypothetical protein
VNAASLPNQISGGAFGSINFFRGDGAFLTPVLEVADQVVDHRAIRLILNGRGQPPFPVLPAQLDPIVAVLNRNPFQLFAIEIDYVAGLAAGFSRVWFFTFEKLNPNAKPDGEKKKDERGPGFHRPTIVRRAAATTRGARESRAPAA